MVMKKNKTIIERRKGPDLWGKVLGWLGVFGWFLMFVALFIIDRAKPQTENIFTKASKGPITHYVGHDINQVSLLFNDIWYYCKYCVG